MSQIRVKDYTGKVIHKKKRGFTTKKEALEWERDFLNKATANMGMLFQDFAELYFEDMIHRLKESTLISITLYGGQKNSSSIWKDPYQRDYAERYPQMAEQFNCLSG